MTPADLAPFALLDQSGGPGAPGGRLYTGFAREHRCTDPATLDAVWAKVVADQARGLHPVLLADYEWGAKLLPAGCQSLAPGEASALRVLMFDSLAHLHGEQIEAWLAAADRSATPSPAGFAGWQASVSKAEYRAAIERIHGWIAAGETYQLNYTYRLNGRAFGSPVGLYRRLRTRQAVAFGALIRLPAGDQTEWVVSCSPELFVENRGGKLTTRPMKGTAPRAADPQQDQTNAQWLAADEKNQAENRMIVDLLRNDLGRVAETGSVKVPALFAIESYRTVHQMTSTVTAHLRPGLNLPAVLRALFPCGSITGAPKHHTMDLIARLETTPRGIYCGAIGWADAVSADQHGGDFCLSVAIRTLMLGPERDGWRATQLGVGGGIVIDSKPEAEWEETRTKARFATALAPGFTLFETMLAAGGTIALLDAHLKRLAASATELGFAFDERAARTRIAHQLATLPADVPQRVRIDLSHDGALSLRSAPRGPQPTAPVRLVLSPIGLPPAESALVQHKTSLRSTYDAAIRAAESQGAFDSLFFNARGELTEGARSSVFIQLDQQWFTPPLSAGLLPGVMRAQTMLALGATERPLHRSDLERAQALLVCNALRGALAARL
ncbi:MAG: aminodeoxychorismate synthase component I [Burkholderiaceae bacterium]